MRKKNKNKFIGVLVACKMHQKCTTTSLGERKRGSMKGEEERGREGRGEGGGGGGERGWEGESEIHWGFV